MTVRQGLGVQSSPNKALQRRPRRAVLMASFNAARGPAERERWATCPPSLTSRALLAKCLVGFAPSSLGNHTPLAAIARRNRRHRADGQPRNTRARRRIVWPPVAALDALTGGQRSPIVGCNGG